MPGIQDVFWVSCSIVPSLYQSSATTVNRDWIRQRCCGVVPDEILCKHLKATITVGWALPTMSGRARPTFGSVQLFSHPKSGRLAATVNRDRIRQRCCGVVSDEILCKHFKATIIGGHADRADDGNALASSCLMRQSNLVTHTAPCARLQQTALLNQICQLTISRSATGLGQADVFARVHATRKTISTRKQ